MARPRQTNRIETKKDHAIIHIHSKMHGHKQVLIDLEDVEMVSTYCWTYTLLKQSGHENVRAINHNGNGKQILLSRYILEPQKGMVVDHINRDTLDNRRSNLRVVTQQQNMYNRAGSNKSSRYKGVYWLEKNQRFVAKINPMIDGERVQKYLGSFKNEEDAAREYDKWAKLYQGKYGYLNFPNE